MPQLLEQTKYILQPNFDKNINSILLDNSTDHLSHFLVYLVQVIDIEISPIDQISCFSLKSFVMYISNVPCDINDLPTNVLSFVDERFYNFVEARLGKQQALLLKLQHINSVPCFLLADDPCQILNLDIDDHDFNDLKKQVCFQLVDGSFIIKTGVKIGFKCLRDLLAQKAANKAKQSKATKTRPITSPFNIITPNIPSFSTPSQATISSPRSETMPLAPATTIDSSPPIALSPQPPVVVTLSHDERSKSINTHKKYILDLLKQWCNDHADEFMIEKFNLEEGKDFSLNFAYNENDELVTSVKCKCNQVLMLTTKDGFVQLSNYHKHLRMTKCRHIKSIQRLHEEKRNSALQNSVDRDASGSSDSTSISTTNSIHQVPSQASNDSPPTVSSVTKVEPSNTQRAIPEKRSRKRDQSFSQPASVRSKRFRN